MAKRRRILHLLVDRERGLPHPRGQLCPHRGWAARNTARIQLAALLLALGRSVHTSTILKPTQAEPAPRFACDRRVTARGKVQRGSAVGKRGESGRGRLTRAAWKLKPQPASAPALCHLHVRASRSTHPLRRKKACHHDAKIVAHPPPSRPANPTNQPTAFAAEE